MNRQFLIGAFWVLCCQAVLAAGADSASYHSGKLLQMESVQCVIMEEGSSGVASCQEYVLEGDDILFHLHPAKGSKVTLLPIGKTLQYRISEGHFFLRVSGKDREFEVVAMEPRETREAPVHSAEKLNHLQ